MRLLPANIICCILTVLVVNGCSADVKPDTPGAEQRHSQLSVNRDASYLVLVDCLLPGQLRSLGTSRSFLTPRRPVRATVSECEIRGGEIADKNSWSETRIDEEQFYGGMF